jgi:peroxiredoxin
MTTISQQSATISAGSADGLGTEIATVFAEEQRRWRERGEPDGIVCEGEKLDDFTLSDPLGTPVELSQLIAEGPAVIVFYRGGWCPYCNLALRTYQAELLPELPQYGARLVAISPQNPDQSLSTTEKAELSFTVLSDTGAALAARLGLAYTPDDAVLAAQRQLGLDLAQVNASVSLPIPTVLIVDPERRVRFIDVCPDYTQRTEVRSIIGALERLGASRDAAASGARDGAS